MKGYEKYNFFALAEIAEEAGVAVGNADHVSLFPPSQTRDLHQCLTGANGGTCCGYTRISCNGTTI
jgi:hypothetical protein